MQNKTKEQLSIVVESHSEKPDSGSCLAPAGAGCGAE
jgi:hypothetical protein